MRPRRYPYSGKKESTIVTADNELVKPLNLDANNINSKLLDADTITWGDILRLLIL